jgi:hypothetical protein
LWSPAVSLARAKAKYLETMGRIEEFCFFVEAHRIYLPDGICSLLDEFVNALRKPVITVGVYGSIECPNEQTIIGRKDALMEAFAAFEKKIPQARRALETEFRQILGVEQDTKPIESRPAGV